MAVVCGHSTPHTRENAVSMPPNSAPPSHQAPTINKQPPWLDHFIIHIYFAIALISFIGFIAFQSSVPVMRNLVEKAIEKHEADGLARVDYAAASWGAAVWEHSEPRFGKWWGVHYKAVEMLSPSFGEPGRCFELKGRNGFVVVKLRELIVPEAVSIEHVLEAVVDDRTDAPKDCRVTAWLQHDGNDRRENEIVLAEFSYDVEKSNIQTFGVSRSVASSGEKAIVNMVKLEFASNHGRMDSTCIYRFRVHGHRPST